MSADVEESLEDVRRAIDDVEDSTREELEQGQRDELQQARDEFRAKDEALGDARGLADALDAIERMLERIEDELRDLG